MLKLQLRFLSLKAKALSDIATKNKAILEARSSELLEVYKKNEQDEMDIYLMAASLYNPLALGPFAKRKVSSNSNTKTSNARVGENADKAASGVAVIWGKSADEIATAFRKAGFKATIEKKYTRV